MQCFTRTSGLCSREYGSKVSYCMREIRNYIIGEKIGRSSCLIFFIKTCWLWSVVGWWSFQIGMAMHLRLWLS